MRRSCFSVACLLAGMTVLLPCVPVRADVLLASAEETRVLPDGIPSTPAPKDDLAAGLEPEGSVRVGALLNQEEWWEIPLGALFIGVSALLVSRVWTRNIPGGTP